MKHKHDLVSYPIYWDGGRKLGIQWKCRDCDLKVEDIHDIEI